MQAGVKYLLMSDFFLPEVADVAGKDARTIRRWCAAGVVPGAVQTPGGHWRIRAVNLPTAAAFAMRGARGFSRKRTPRKTTISGKPIPAEMLARVEAMKRNQRKKFPAQMAVVRLLDSMPQEFAPDGVWESPFLAESVVSAIAWAMSATGELRPRVEDVSPAFGMDRRKFYRKYGDKLSAARLAALVMLGIKAPAPMAFDDAGDLTATEDFDYDDIDRRNGWSEPVKRP